MKTVLGWWLGVIVEEGSVMEFSNARRPLGPLAGAVAELSDTTHRNWHKTALAFVTFPDGTLHEHQVWDSSGIRKAQRDVAQFNALARAAI